MITLASGKWVAWEGRSPTQEGIYSVLFIAEDGSICQAIARFKGRGLWVSNSDGTYLAWKESE